MSGSRRLVYWDTGLFIAMITNERRNDPADLQGIHEQVRLIEKDPPLLYMATSVITLTEILRIKLLPTAVQTFEQIFQRQNCQMYDVNVRIAYVAQEIREFYSGRNDDLPTIETPDALHLATAIVYDCQTFYTLDMKDRLGKGRSLLSLSGKPVAGRYHIEVSKPIPKQYTMLLP